MIVNFAGADAATMWINPRAIVAVSMHTETIGKGNQMPSGRRGWTCIQLVNGSTVNAVNDVDVIVKAAEKNA